MNNIFTIEIFSFSTQMMLILPKKIHLFFLFFLSFSLFGQQAQQDLAIYPLTDNMYVFRTYNIFKNQRYPSNGLYVLTEKGAILIDSPWDTTQFQPLLDSIQSKHNQKVVMMITTHFHDDRAGGFAYYQNQNIPTYAYEKTQQILKEKNEPLAQFSFKNDTVLQIGNVKFETFFPGQGHTKDNIVIYFPDQEVLYGGCFLKGTGDTSLGNITDANVKAWPKSIVQLKKKYPKIKYAISGHNSWQDPRAIEYTLKLLKTHSENLKDKLSI